MKTRNHYWAEYTAIKPNNRQVEGDAAVYAETWNEAALSAKNLLKEKGYTKIDVHCLTLTDIPCDNK